MKLRKINDSYYLQILFPEVSDAWEVPIYTLPFQAPEIEITNLYKCGVSKNSYCATHTTFQANRKDACKHGLDRTMKSNVTLLSHWPHSGRTRSGNLTNETLSGWVAATVVEQWHSPPAAGTLPCGSTKGVAQATAVPKSKEAVCVMCKIHHTDLGLACKVGATRFLSNHICLWLKHYCLVHSQKYITLYNLL